MRTRWSACNSFGEILCGPSRATVHPTRRFRGRWEAQDPHRPQITKRPLNHSSWLACNCWPEIKGKVRNLLEDPPCPISATTMHPRGGTGSGAGQEGVRVVAGGGHPDILKFLSQSGVDVVMDVIAQRSVRRGIGHRTNISAFIEHLTSLPWI